MASLGESSRMNHLMRQKSAAFRKKRRFQVQQDPELRAAFGRRRLLELFVSAEDSPYGRTPRAHELPILDSWPGLIRRARTARQ